VFPCESAVLRTHWALVVMDQCTRRIGGFGVHRGDVDSVGHAGLDWRTPESSTDPGGVRASVSSYRWQPHCRGSYQTRMAA
jgi:hypothetical protein